MYSIERKLQRRQRRRKKRSLAKKRKKYEMLTVACVKNRVARRMEHSIEQASLNTDKARLQSTTVWTGWPWVDATKVLDQERAQDLLQRWRDMFPEVNQYLLGVHESSQKERA